MSSIDELKAQMAIVAAAAETLRLEREKLTQMIEASKQSAGPIRARA